MVCRCHLAPLSATIHTFQATHSQHHTLLNSYKMVRSPLLRSHLLQYRRLMVLLLQALCPAHCYHAVQSAHKSLRVPLATSQVMQCRSLRPSRSSHSLSSYSAAESRLLLPSRLSHQCPPHFWMLLCRRLHLVTSLRRCPRRRLINRTRFRVMWQCRRLPTVSVPHLWMLPCRRSHPVPCLSMSLRRWVLAQLPRFLLICLCRLLYAVRCYMMLPHNYRSRSSSLAVSTRTILWTAETWFVSPRHQCKVHMPCCSRRQDSNSHPRLLSLPLTLTCLLHVVRPLTVFPVMPSSRLSVPPLWEHTLCAQLPAPKEVLVPPLREPTILLVLILVQEQVPSLNHGHWFFPWSNLGNPSLTGLVTLIQLTAISCIINSVFPFFSGIKARRAEILPTLSLLPVESFMRLFFKKPVIMFRTSPISSGRTPTTWTSLSCLNKDTFEPDPIVLTFKADSTNKSTWGMVLLIVQGLLRRPSLSGSPTVTFCSVHIHNVVAKKRDASTELLQFLHAKMREHNVDFISGDFNMSAFSTVSDVFSDPEFSAPGHSCLWGLGALDEQHRECTGFLIMPKRPYEWRVDSYGCYKFDDAALGLGPRGSICSPPLCSSIFATPIFPDPAVSCAVSKHNKEGLTANITNLSVRGNDAHDHAPVHQGVSDAARQDHMSLSRRVSSEMRLLIGCSDTQDVLH